MLLRRGNALRSIKSLSSVNLVCSTRQFSPDSFAKIALEQRSGKGISKIPRGNSKNERDRGSTGIQVPVVRAPVFWELFGSFVREKVGEMEDTWNLERPRNLKMF